MLHIRKREVCASRALEAIRAAQVTAKRQAAWLLRAVFV